MLNTKTVAEHLRRHYGIEGDIKTIPKGRASNYLVSRHGERWLLKVFQPDYRSSRVEQAADFVSFVARAGYPTQEFVTASDGARTVMLADRVAVLIPWIDGDTPEANTVSSRRALGRIGALCGYLHRLGAGYPHASALEYSGSRSSVADKQAALMRVATGQRSAPELADEVEIRVKILSRLGDALFVSQQNAKPGMIHGDFSGAHVVFQGDRAVGVIDVMGELYLPGWELMRAFFQSVPCGAEPPKALEEPWRGYLEGYARERPIDPHEVAVAYDVYLLQLTGSTYGLRPPLDTELRAFGRWRTHLAWYLAEHRPELRDMMASHARLKTP